MTGDPETFKERFLAGLDALEYAPLHETIAKLQRELTFANAYIEELKDQAEQKEEAHQKGAAYLNGLIRERGKSCVVRGGARTGEGKGVEPRSTADAGGLCLHMPTLH